MIRLSAAFVGLDFVSGIKQERNVFADATRVAISAAADGLKLELRQQVQAAGLGERLGNAVASKVYPLNGKSLHPAALVYPRGRLAERIFEAFNTGATIKAKNKSFIAIPTKNAWVGGKGRKRPTPAEFERHAGIKLSVIPSKRPGVLLLAGKRYRGKVRGGSRDSLIYFVLVPEVRMGRRLAFDAIAARWAARVPDLIDRAMPGT